MLETLNDLNVNLVFVNDIRMKDQHQHSFLRIVIHHYETLFHVDDDEMASIKKRNLANTRERKKQERKNKRKKKETNSSDDSFVWQ
jgi:hypothetical protein